MLDKRNKTENRGACKTYVRGVCCSIMNWPCGLAHFVEGGPAPLVSSHGHFTTCSSVAKTAAPFYLYVAVPTLEQAT